MPIACHRPHALISRRQWTGFDGLFFDESTPGAAWIREHAFVCLPLLNETTTFVAHGEFHPHLAIRGLETSPLGADFSINGRKITGFDSLRPGPLSVRFTIDYSKLRSKPLLHVRLRGVGLTNFLAWLARVAAPSRFAGKLQRFRQQNKNRQFRLTRIETANGLVVFDFSNQHTAFSSDFARHHGRLGLNVAGFLTGDLGIGESARCMVRAADTVQLPVALVDLDKFHCKSRRGDLTYSARLQHDNPHAVNIIHLDPPASACIDRHHPSLRRHKYNIAYWAWELPDFPQGWLKNCDYFDEIWCPSDFTRDSMAGKTPLAVYTMPHAISFPRPGEPSSTLRARLGLPADKFLFLLIYDLNSYSQRKNPGAVIGAFRASGLAGRGAALVIKTHGTAGNETALAALRVAIAGLPEATLLTETLSRTDIYALEAACDCLVSLHRSEGFGLVVAECMFLGKPVIATDWSATAEFLNETNGCPVRASLVTLETSHGPYSKGQTWAEPDVAHAAWWMQTLAADPGLGVRLGAAARATIEKKFAPAVIGALYRERLAHIACW
jgi:glycosyltransferase involved in cell wall biosynthesis